MRADRCASRWQILVKIVLPLSIPGLISAFIFCFTLCWNEFIYALTFPLLDAEQDRAGRHVNEFADGDIYRWARWMAGALVGSLPLVILYASSSKLCVGDDRCREGVRHQSGTCNNSGNHHETSPPEIPAAGRGRCRSAVRAAHRKSASLSNAAGTVDCWLCSRWHTRPVGALYRRMAIGAARAAICNRKPAGGR
jgi:hypothetical protein